VHARDSGPPAGPPAGLVVALDGPASSGKSSVGARAAAELGYRFCDTGLLYRAVTWLSLDRGIGADDPDGLVRLVDEIELVDDGSGSLAHVTVGGVDRTEDVRSPAVDVAVSGIASVAELRLALLTRQRHLASTGGIVMAGRDIGTVVLPNADLKLYLDASAEERARRRVLERGIDADSDEAREILDDLRRRDERDSSRAVAPLRAPDDAVIIRTDGNELGDTVRAVVAAIRAAADEQGTARAEAAPAARSVPAPTEAEVAPPRRLRATGAPRAERRPLPQTPVATRNTLFLRAITGLLRLVVRAIVRFRVEGDLASLPRSGALCSGGR